MSTIPEAVVRLVDDNPDFLTSLEFMLAIEGWKTRSYAGAGRFLAEDDAAAPGCLILDVQMPGISGPELQQQLLAAGRSLPIIFLTAHGSIDLAVETLREGAFDFQQKPVDPEKLLPAIARAVRQSRRGLAAPSDMYLALKRLDALTAREQKVLRLVAVGLTSRQIAERLGLSKTTVDHQRAAGAEKIGAATPAAVAAFFEDVDGWIALHPGR